MKRIFTTLVLVIAALGAQAQLLYQITGKGLQQPSYIIGTYHLAQASFADSIPGLPQALEQCQQVYGELVMDDMTSPDNIARLQQAMMLPEGTTIQQLLSSDEMDRLNAYMRGLMGMDMTNPLIAEQLGKMRPSTLSTQFALLTFMKKHGTIITDLSNQFDQYFQRYAREHAKEVGGLETLDFQIKVLYQGQTLERQKELLMCQIDNAQFMDEMAEDIIKAFYSQDLDAIEQAMDKKLDSSCDSTPEENAQLITDRNADWLTKMPSIMADKPTFFAVGAAHLAGDDGVLSLLRKAGYTVSAVTK